MDHGMASPSARKLRNEVHLYIIGFTGESAEQFFGFFRGANVRRIIDVRQSNSAQLAAVVRRLSEQPTMWSMISCWKAATDMVFS